MARADRRAQPGEDGKSTPVVGGEYEPEELEDSSVSPSLSKITDLDDSDSFPVKQACFL